MAHAQPVDEFCTSCGEWTSPLHFNYELGWCNFCSPESDAPHCTRCGDVLPTNHGRTTCHTCRQELWLERHSNELEYLIVVKGYSLNKARQVLIKLVRPICQHCRKPIKGASEGSLFCKSKKPCHRAYGIYNRLLKKGLTKQQALDRLKGQNQGR